MSFDRSRRRGAHRATRRARAVPLVAGLALLAGTAPAWAGTAGASPGGHGTPIVPGDLLVSTSTYQDDPGIVATTTQLPPGCSATATAPDPCGTAVANGTYPYVFNNSVVDASFGITSPIVLDELSPEGHEIGTVEVPNSSEPGVAANADQMVTSFSSKSELALNLSPNGQYVTFMGYKAGVGTVDVSNANTPGDVDPTSADPGAYYRVVGELGQDGRIRYTETNAFSGDNGRAAISARVGGRTVVYGAGNAGNGANPEPPQVVLGSGAQFVQPSDQPEAAQDPGQPTPIGSFNVYKQLGYTGDKVAKDDNFRGVTIEDTVVYYTKGSGSNGVNTVYFVDTTGKACPGGTGVPEPGAPLPGSANVLSYTPTAAPTIVKKHSTTTNPGLVPEDMCILRGFPTVSAGTTTASTFPFGMWFANPDTLYVADEGNGDNTDTTASATANGTYTTAASSPTAGLQKWVFNQAAQSWGLAYTLQAGLDLGQPYSVPGYPTGLNDGPGGTTLPWAPATDGLRNLTGRVNSNGTVSIWATTSTVSGSGDQGADPNELVEVTDQLGATAPPSWAHFQTVMAPQSGTVVRGVSFTPGTRACQGPDRNRDADHDGDGCTRPSPGPHHPGRGSDGEDAVGPATGPRGS